MAVRTYAFDIRIQPAALAGALRSYIYLRSIGSDELKIVFAKEQKVVGMSLTCHQQNSTPIQLAIKAFARLEPLSAAGDKIPMIQASSIDSSSNLSFSARNTYQVSAAQKMESKIEGCFGFSVVALGFDFDQNIDTTQQVYFTFQVDVED